MSLATCTDPRRGTIGSSTYIRVVSTVLGEKLGLAKSSHSRQSCHRSLPGRSDRATVNLGHHRSQHLRRFALVAADCSFDRNLATGYRVWPA